MTLNGLSLFEVWVPDTEPHPVLQEVSGLLGGAPWRAATGERAGTDGNWHATPTRGPRSGSLKGQVFGPDPVTVEQWGDLLLAATHGTRLPLTFHYASGPRTLLVRVDGEVDLVRSRLAYEIGWQVPVIAEDPLWYLGDGVTPGFTATVQRAREIGGVTFPLSFPLAWDSSVAYGAADYWNPGTGGRLEFRLDGPLTAPMVTTINADGPRVLSWPTLSLAAGEWLDINPARRIALVQGQASRPPAVRQWPRLAAGANHWQFTAGSGEGTLTVRAWPAY